MTWNSRNIIGQRFEQLVVVEKTTKRKHGSVVWLCRCDCGNLKEVDTTHIRYVRSCGCFRSKTTAKKNYKHGLSKTKEYNKQSSHIHRAKGYKTVRQFYSPLVIQQHMKLFGNKCVYCDGAFQEIDHFIPLSKGGTHSLDNLVPSCMFCNRSKNNRLFGTEWLPHDLGFDYLKEL